ncbi:hypothetical protein [Actinoplanes couchii]|uniref:hypothetical protein n=1 Tax=Actinoplanes couchii TaxID=403638 RepID=UPI0019458C68|nr:hypothetical protein [Actinoplanes couchii]MDR6319699.1 hypothetical protein [Actinoplanes couchii]
MISRPRNLPHARDAAAQPTVTATDRVTPNSATGPGGWNAAFSRLFGRGEPVSSAGRLGWSAGRDA